jgi:hypothetical protein
VQERAETKVSLPDRGLARLPESEQLGDRDLSSSGDLAQLDETVGSALRRSGADPSR